jgi:DNA-3-methyladenine glycosylase II
VAIELTASEIEKGRRRLRRSEPVMGDLVRRVGRCTIAPGGRPYRYLMRSVLYQQLATAAAAKIEQRVRALGKGQIPAAKRIPNISDAAFREAGLSRQKIVAFRSIADAFASGRVRPDALPRMSNEEVQACVTEIHGVGEWTAHMLLMFSLGRRDILPVGDYGVQKAAQNLYKLKELPKKKQLLELAEPWRPYASLASWYLWRSHDPIDS